ncbi:MAG: ATP-binding cassette domain-containing protein [Ruminococcaceae bacterium]|nr:ATP-binding cassette domain-containing protein [Oscillospiraceae bacterium]
MENNHQEVLLKVDHLCQYFRLGHKDMKAVDDVSFEIRKGETFGLVGESGCGKTTTGRSIIKLYNITSGNVYFKGQRIGAGTRSYKDAMDKARDDAAKKIKQLRAEKNADAARKAEIQEEIRKINENLAAVIAKNRALIKDAKTDSREVDRQYAASALKALEAEYAEKFNAAKDNPEQLAALKKEYSNRCRVAKKSKLITQIQMIFQDPIASLDPRMTVRDIIAEGLVINGITDQDYINEKVYEILETVGLVREHADRYPHEFSGGQRQRIGIARAVIMQPEMIIADEPISALDVSIQAQVINLLNDLRERLGLTIMFIAHDLSVVKYFSDRIGVMYFGKMVELADSDELFKNPLHPYTRSLLSAIPLPDPIYEKQRTRIHYNPIAEHDYSVDTPSFREITPGHFVHCNDAEEEKYKQMVK